MSDTESSLEVRLIPALSNNYIYCLKDKSTGKVGVVDPGASEPVCKVIDAEYGGRLDRIFITHHHGDHTDGVAELVSLYGADVVASASEQAKFSSADLFVNAGDRVSLGDSQAEVYFTPGHTSGHISYGFTGHLFCGDALFSCGCGKMFEGNAEEFWQGLKTLKSLDDETLIWCGHELTLGNIKYARFIDPDNVDLCAYEQEAQRLRDQGRPTLPQTLGAECRRNPFLRADDQEFAAQLGLEGRSEAEMFAHLRAGKDKF